MSKYLSLYQKIKNDIQQGVYKPESRLPSKRTLADLYGASLTTVEKAYGMLFDEGYIFSVEKKGYYVSKAIDTRNFAVKKTNENLKLLPLPKKENYADGFEYSLWFKTIRKVLNDNGELLFRKSPQMGCEVLRNAVSEYLLRYRNMVAQPSNIIIGSGAEQLYETAVLLLGRNKVYGIENPCYSRILTVYGGMGIKLKKLNMGKDGIKASELEYKDFEVLHVTPFHSFPSGVTTSITKRTKYLNWATKNGSFIIEDDYDSEFFAKGHPIDTLYSLCKDNSVIYINTFSKSLSPALRLGYMIIPDSLLSVYEDKMKDLSCSVPVLDQYILADFINSGNFERHLGRKRRKM